MSIAVLPPIIEKICELQVDSEENGDFVTCDVLETLKDWIYSEYDGGGFL